MSSTQNSSGAAFTPETDLPNLPPQRHIQANGKDITLEEFAKKIRGTTPNPLKGVFTKGGITALYDKYYKKRDVIVTPPNRLYSMILAKWGSDATMNEFQETVTFPIDNAASDWLCAEFKDHEVVVDDGADICYEVGVSRTIGEQQGMAVVHNGQEYPDMEAFMDKIRAKDQELVPTELTKDHVALLYDLYFKKRRLTCTNPDYIFGLVADHLDTPIIADENGTEEIHVCIAGSAVSWVLDEIETMNAEPSNITNDAALDDDENDEDDDDDEDDENDDDDDICIDLPPSSSTTTTTSSKKDDSPSPVEENASSSSTSQSKTSNLEKPQDTASSTEPRKKRQKNEDASPHSFGAVAARALTEEKQRAVKQAKETSKKTLLPEEYARCLREVEEHAKKGVSDVFVHDIMFPDRLVKMLKLKGFESVPLHGHRCKDDAVCECEEACLWRVHVSW